MGKPAAERYVAERIVTEDAYRTALGIDNDVLSFSYATVAGFHRMEQPLDYPGFTYFFRLGREDVSRTLFGVVTGDPLLSVPSESGVRGLERCLEHWGLYSGLFQAVDEPYLGTVNPRVEVVISYPVRPTSFITQVEDRTPTRISPTYPPEQELSSVRNDHVVVRVRTAQDQRSSLDASPLRARVR